MILDPKRAQKLLEGKPDLRAVILSGGPAMIHDKDAPKPPAEIFSLRRPNNRPVPINGICYGMQLITHRFGGKVGPVADKREYGPAEVCIDPTSSLFLKTPKQQRVWASHGDSVLKVPKGFRIIGNNESGGIAAMADPARDIWCTLFHPEVSHTRFGKQILRNFAYTIAGCEADWRPSSMIEDIRKKALTQLGNQSKAVLGFSGGVDSTTLAAILSKSLGKRLLCVTVDGGQFREKELTEIRRNAKLADVTLKIVNAKAEFAHALAGIIDAEEKRKAFRRVYAALLVRAARQFGAAAIIQGTLATDMIESGAMGGELIKSHHNVGIKLPSGLAGLHPFGHLFKYEIRALARKLGLPKTVWNRQPFPGPGLFIRIVNTPVNSELLELLSWADARVRETLIRCKAQHKASQLVVSYQGRLVGVKGDARCYGAHFQVRGVKTIDYMTAEGVRFATTVKKEVETVLAQHPGIVAVSWNEMPKPPCTTEPE